MEDFVGRIRSPHSTMAAGRDVNWLLDRQAERRANHPFLIWEPFSGSARTWTYRQLRDDVLRLAGGLQARGIGPGDTVVVHLDNSPEFLLSWFALVRLGAVAVCTNTRSAPDEMRYFGEHSEAVAVITQPRYAAMLGAAIPRAKWLAVTGTDAGDEPETGTVAAAGERFDALFVDEVPAPAAITPYSAASIQYTSGTTSRPKAVVWTHANCVWGGRVSASHESLRADDVHLTYLPLFHTNAQSYSILATLAAGATTVLQPRFSASRFWDVSLRHRCTWTSLVPFCVKALESHDVPKHHHYRLWGNGVSSPRQDATFGVRTMGWWGMTETVTHGICDDHDNPGRPMTCGRPAPEYEIAVLRPDSTSVDPGETGELLVRGVPGVSLFAGYLHDQAATAAAVDTDGWLTTGDLVTPNADGSITFADRAKDMLKVGGENVAASEIERVIMGVPGVAEVAVVAAPHDMLGEVPAAFVVPATPDDHGLRGHIDAACQQQLADFKRPERVEIVDDLPRSTLNKVAKAQLRRQLADRRA
jgi:carnitine-CoA ligase